MLHILQGIFGPDLLIQMLRLEPDVDFTPQNKKKTRIGSGPGSVTPVRHPCVFIHNLFKEYPDV